MRTGIRTCFALCWLAWATGAGAVTLGPIAVESTLGEPLAAAIPLDPHPEPLDGFSVRLASPEQYQEHGLVYSPILGRVRAEIHADGNSPTIRLTSQRPITEPALEFLVELSWDGGRILRRYTALFNPPPLGGRLPAVLPVALALVVRSPRPAPAGCVPAKRHPAPST